MKNKIFSLVLSCIIIFTTVASTSCNKASAQVLGFEVKTEMTAEIGTELAVPSFSPKDTEGVDLQIDTTVSDVNKKDIPFYGDSFFVSEMSEYNITYIVTKGADKITKSSKVKVVDTMPPSIQIKKYISFARKNEKVALPTLVYKDNSANDVNYEIIVLHNGLQKVEVNKESFTAIEGRYDVNITARDVTGNNISKTIKVYVKGDNEIESFDYVEYLRNVSARDTAKLTFNSEPKFVKSGTGSLRITAPGMTNMAGSAEERWPGFNLDVPGIKDISKGYAISFWIYNDSDSFINISINTLKYVRVEPRYWQKIIITSSQFTEYFYKNPSTTDITNFHFWFKNFAKTTEVYVDEIKYYPTEASLTTLEVDTSYVHAGSKYIVPAPSLNGKLLTGTQYDVIAFNPDGTKIVIDNEGKITTTEYGKYKLIYTTKGLKDNAMLIKGVVALGKNDEYLDFDNVNQISTFYDATCKFELNNDKKFSKDGIGSSVKLTATVLNKEYDLWPKIQIEGLIDCDVTKFSSLSFWVYNPNNYDVFLVLRKDWVDKTLPSKSWTKITISLKDWPSMLNWFTGSDKFEANIKQIKNVSFAEMWYTIPKGQQTSSLYFDDLRLTPNDLPLTDAKVTTSYTYVGETFTIPAPVKNGEKINSDLYDIKVTDPKGNDVKVNNNQISIQLIGKYTISYSNKGRKDNTIIVGLISINDQNQFMNFDSTNGVTSLSANTVISTNTNSIYKKDGSAGSLSVKSTIGKSDQNRVVKLRIDSLLGCNVTEFTKLSFWAYNPGKVDIELVLRKDWVTKILVAGSWTQISLSLNEWPSMLEWFMGDANYAKNAIGLKNVPFAEVYYTIPQGETISSIYIDDMRLVPGDLPLVSIAAETSYVNKGERYTIPTPTKDGIAIDRSKYDVVVRDPQGMIVTIDSAGSILANKVGKYKVHYSNKRRKDDVLVRGLIVLDQNNRFVNFDELNQVSMISGPSKLSINTNSIYVKDGSTASLKVTTTIDANNPDKMTKIRIESLIGCDVTYFTKLSFWVYNPNSFDVFLVLRSLWVDKILPAGQWTQIVISQKDWPSMLNWIAADDKYDANIPKLKNVQYAEISFALPDGKNMAELYFDDLKLTPSDLPLVGAIAQTGYAFVGDQYRIPVPTKDGIDIESSKYDITVQDSSGNNISVNVDGTINVMTKGRYAVSYSNKNKNDRAIVKGLIVIDNSNEYLNFDSLTQASAMTSKSVLSINTDSMYLKDTGVASLKFTTTVSDENTDRWPKIQIDGLIGCDVTKFKEISFWVYNPNAYDVLLMVRKDWIEKTLPAGKWTQVVMSLKSWPSMLEWITGSADYPANESKLKDIAFAEMWYTIPIGQTSSTLYFDNLKLTPGDMYLSGAAATTGYIRRGETYSIPVPTKDGVPLTNAQYDVSVYDPQGNSVTVNSDRTIVAQDFGRYTIAYSNKGRNDKALKRGLIVLGDSNLFMSFDDLNQASMLSNSSVLSLNTDTSYVRAGGNVSLKMTTTVISEATDIWPKIQFDALMGTDVTTFSNLSFWVYNPNNYAITLVLRQQWVDKVLQPGQWTKVSLNLKTWPSILEWMTGTSNYAANEPKLKNVGMAEMWYTIPTGQTTSILYFDDLTLTP